MDNQSFSLCIFVLISISLLSVACSVQKVYDLDSARQLAVNKIMDDDTYTQYDGFNFTELSAENSGCDACYRFAYVFDTDQQYLPGIKGYLVDVMVRENIIENMTYTEIPAEQSTRESPSNNTIKNAVNNTLPPIAERFDKFCENKCGDGYCDDNVCHDARCVCEESHTNCPEDC